MKNKNISKFVISLVYIILGIALVIKTNLVEDVFCYALAGCAVIVGVIKLAAYMITDVDDRIAHDTNGFAVGVCLIILGIFVFFKGTMVIMLIPFALGFMITFKGIEGIQNVLNLKKLGYDYSKPMLIISLAIALFGVLIMYNPFATAKVLFQMMGIGLVVSGAADLVADIIFTGKLKDGK